MTIEQALNHYEKLFIYFANRYAHSPEEARDFAQEARVNLVRKWALVPTDASVASTYVGRICRNAVIDMVRKADCRPCVSLDDPAFPRDFTVSPFAKVDEALLAKMELEVMAPEDQAIIRAFVEFGHLDTAAAAIGMTRPAYTSKLRRLRKTARQKHGLDVGWVSGKIRL